MNLSKKLLLFTFTVLMSVSCLDQIASLNTNHNDNEREIYIVYMGELPENTISLTDVHHNILSEAIGDEKIARNSMIHSYGRSFNGFAARLLPHEAKLLSQKKSVVSVFPNKKHKLQTTRSWDFLGFPEKVKRKKQVESNIIVALIDTGIWVESPSFNDEGFGPPPPKWKGTCAKVANFTGCNNKVIGAQYFNSGQPKQDATPVDDDGHGTHTASTAAGSIVEDASLYGIAKGTARGGVPSARIASYKACWLGDCFDVDILAAFDAAIADGVDIISASIGSSKAHPGGQGGYILQGFIVDSITIGAFHAMKKGILTVCGGGNEGPEPGTVSNFAPWVMTVAASTIDRKLETNIKLGNGEIISGIAVNTFVPKKKFYPLTSGLLAKNSSGDLSGNASACEDGTLSQNKVEGKIIYCELGAGQDDVIKGLGGAGTIMSDDVFSDTAFSAVLPATYVSLDGGHRVNKYINSTRLPLAVIYKTRTVKIVAPSIASFSSRGPEPLNINILKPDIAAPGVDILAAYSIFATLTGDEDDKRVVKYNIISGTSMACPHVSGAAAYVKTFYPKWSPAAIKSALMTTSKRLKIKPVGAELASGSGQINPKAALNPGLVYDIDTISYISFLCKQRYSYKNIALITGSKKYNCSNIPQARGVDGLNYPSIHMQVQINESAFVGVFHRTVTNVGLANSTYKAKVISPRGLAIEVTPKILRFSRLNQKKSYKVTLKGKSPQKKFWYLSGSLVWKDSEHKVRSPILVSPPALNFSSLNL